MTGVQTCALPISGDLEVALDPPEVMAQAVVKGADIRILGSGARSAIFCLAAGNHLDTADAAKGYPAAMQDLKGKKVGVTARGTGAEFQLLDLLKSAGMSAADVTLVAVGAPNTALPAPVNKQVDAVMTFEPMGGCCDVRKASLPAYRFSLDPKAVQAAADYLLANKQLDKPLDTSKLLYIR